MFSLQKKASKTNKGLTAVCPCIVSIIMTDDQLDATILDYLFIPSQLYMFRAMYSPIIRRTWLYLRLLVLFTDRQHYRWIVPEAVNTVKFSWWWVKTLPKICTADWVQANKPKAAPCWSSITKYALILVLLVHFYELPIFNNSGTIQRKWTSSNDFKTS